MSKYADQKTDQYRTALLAASTMYPHAYANARAAYIFAIGVAARYPEGQEQSQAFKASMAERLKADIKYELVAPSLFMQVMCSTLIKFIALGLLITSVFALPVGVSGLMVVSIAETLISMGINSMILTQVPQAFLLEEVCGLVDFLLKSVGELK